MGPNVGPDGNIYGATADRNEGGLGIFVLSPTGEVLYNRTNMAIRGAYYAWEVAFGGGAAYFTSGMGGPLTGEIATFAINLGGGERWERGGRGQVRSGPAGRAHITDGNWVVSYNPDGSDQWRISMNVFGGQVTQGLAVGPDDTCYVPVQSATVLWAVASDGSIRWHRTGLPRPMSMPVVSPEGTLVVGGGAGFGPSQPSMVMAVNASDGTTAWTVSLPAENSSNVTQQWCGDFSPDAATYYMGTSAFNDGTDPWSYVYAIETGLGTPCVADWDGDGAVNSGDIAAFLTAWLGSLQAGTLAADVDGNAVVNSADISAFLALWLDGVSGGCD
jgi:outer membrane protein assembly factor BamB